MRHSEGETQQNYGKLHRHFDLEIKMKIGLQTGTHQEFLALAPSSPHTNP
jgi:hypothetical protein